MADSVPPVVRGEFLYSDTFLVDVGGPGKRHPRASESELQNLLNGKAPKDQVAHFYEAQLIHYGLARSKEKNTYKVRLQTAINLKALKVPSYVTDLEAQMKKEYASAVRKSKAKSKVSANDAAASTPSTQKRKNIETESASAKRTKFSMTVGDISINVEHGSTSATKQQSTPKASKSQPKAASSRVDKADSKPSKAAATPKKAKVKASKQDDAPQSSGATTAPEKSKGSLTKAGSSPAAKISTGKPKAKKAQAEYVAKPEPTVKTEPKAKAEPKVKSEPKVKTEAKVKKEPKVQGKSSIKREPRPEPQSEEDTHSMMSPGPEVYDELQQTVGQYDIVCEQVVEQLPEYRGALQMFFDYDSEGKLWGRFEMAHYVGWLHATAPRVGDTFTFGWRAWDTDRDIPKFGRGCHGNLEFNGDGQVRGVIFNMFPETVDFDGNRVGPVWEEDGGVDAYIREWYNIVR